MITKKMKEYLESLKTNPKKTVKHCVYMHRIQKRLAREMDMLLWLCVNHPEVFLDQEKEYCQTGKITSHRRLRKLLLCVKAVNPKCKVQLVLKELQFPEDED